MLSHLGGEGVKSSQCLAVAASFVRNTRAAGSTWPSEVILILKEEMVGDNGGVIVSAPPQESIIFEESKI